MSGRLAALVPFASFALALALWEFLCRAFAVPHYMLPAPSLIMQTLLNDWPVLGPALVITLKVTVLALLLAIIGGIGLGIALDGSRWLSLSLTPFMVILQVMPMIAIAPLMLIYLEPATAVLICAFIVAFFPILSGTVVGLKSADHNLQDLFSLYDARAWQRLWLLKLPSALPFILTGMKVGGGLALIGAIVGEFTAGNAGQGSGLAFRILESQYRLNIPRLFAALVLISLAGLVIYAMMSLLSRLLLKGWHESERAREG